MNALRDLALMAAIFVVFVIGASGTLWAGLSMAGMLDGEPEESGVELGEGEAATATSADEPEIPEILGDPDSADSGGPVSYDEALAAYGRGETERSIELFRRAAERDPDNADIHRGLSTVLLQTSRNREAVLALRELARVSDDPTEQRGLQVMIAALENTDLSEGSGDATELLAALGKLPPAPGDDTIVPMGQGLSRAAVSAVFERHERQLLPCFKRAKKNGRVGAGELVLSLNMRINAQGRVKKLRLEGPEEVATASIQQCVRAAAKRWRFPKASLPTDLEEYAVTITLP